MALQKTIVLENGLSINDAYIRIDAISGYKKEIQISVNSYISQQDFINNKPYLEQNFYNFIPNIDESSLNFIKQGYVYLKSLDKYRDAKDC